MKPSIQTAISRRQAMLALAGTAASLAACGGGGVDIAGLSSGGTGSFTSGTITGFGSIIVNGIRYDDSKATIVHSDDDSTRRVLDLGMVVAIEGSAIAPPRQPGALPTAVATRISFGAEWVGPVSNLATSSFDILGHTVRVSASTVFSGVATGVATLNTSHFAEVHGYVNPATRQIDATRVEVSAVRPTRFRLSGAITGINRAARNAALGPLLVLWNDPVVLPAGVSDGAFVRIALEPVPAGNGWLARSIRPVTLLENLSAVDDDYSAEVEGVVTAFVSRTSFRVNGFPVDASVARVEGSLAAGVRVEVEGALRAGTLVASKVEVKNRIETESDQFEFYGTPTAVTAQTFEVRGRVIQHDANTRNRSILNMNPLPLIEVKAVLRNGQLYAVELDIED